MRRLFGTLSLLGIAPWCAAFSQTQSKAWDSLVARRVPPIPVSVYVRIVPAGDTLAFAIDDDVDSVYTILVGAAPRASSSTVGTTDARSVNPNVVAKVLKSHWPLGWVTAAGLRRDHLWVWEQSRSELLELHANRISRVTYRRMAPRLARAIVIPRTVQSSGHLVVEEVVTSQGALDLSQTGRYVYQINAAGVVLDTLAVLRQDNGVFQFGHNGKALSIANAWAATDLLVTSPSGATLAVVRQAQPTGPQASVSILRLGRSAIDSFTVVLPAQRVTTKIVNGFLDSLAQTPFGKSFPSQAQARMAMGSSIYVPPYMAVIRAAIASDNGTIWLRHPNPTGDLWISVGPDGQRGFDFLAPQGFELKAVGHRIFWGTCRRPNVIHVCAFTQSEIRDP